MNSTSRWQNVSAGPRQVKDLQKAIRALRCEGMTRDELTGVIGGEERSWSRMAVTGGPRPEVTVLDEAIRARYGCQVTRQNVRAIIADYEAALPVARRSRPVEDNRHTPEEDAEIQARRAARDAREQARRDAESALLAQVMAKAPRGAQALIIAEYHEDASDPMTGYFATRTRRTAAIGFRFSSREDFRALRAAAAHFSETAGREFTEHRDNHSMGAGNYLSDHGWAGAGTGWLIKSASFPCRQVNLTEDAIPDTPAAPPAAGSGAGASVTVSPSSPGREGVVEIRFAGKPAADVLAALKAHGFRWARGNRCWYDRDAAYAASLAIA
jgi:hypothetical protein